MAVRRPLPDAAGEHSVRVMRWTFRRQQETIVCELGLNRDQSAYELRITPPWNPTGVGVETFNDATAAFERHGFIERCLIDDGWSLECFERAVR